MKRTTEYRRLAALAVLVLFAVRMPSEAQEAGQGYGAQDESVESTSTIRSTAQAYVKSLIPPSAGESTVTVGQLDGRLRLARCPSKELSASLPPGVALQARSTVGV